MSIQPRHLILKLMLGAQGSALSARAAVASCALFGIRENSVRVALVRLSAAGMIEAAGRGSYRIGPSAAQLADDVRTWRTAESRVRKWSGAFVAVHTAALGRTDRGALRQRERALELLGFRELSQDLFVRPDNLVGGVGAVRERLMKLGLDAGALVFLASELGPDHARGVHDLWDGQALTKSYQQTRGRLEKWLARAPKLDLDVAARECFLMGNDAIRQVVFDPLLPDPLVSADERRAFVETVLRYDRAGQTIWRRFLQPLLGDAAESALQAH
ncbi:MAG: PaaX family transcriptional regulator C-terminal domain-containing protein [Myxococcales bacterium]